MSRPPAQGELDAVFEGVTRARVLEVESVLFEVSERAELDELHRALHVEEVLGLHCMCVSTLALELHGPEGARAELRVHDDAIRWDARWDTDARLVRPRLLLEWLARHGLPGPLDNHDERTRAGAWSIPRREGWASW